MHGVQDLRRPQKGSEEVAGRSGVGAGAGAGAAATGPCPAATPALPIGGTRSHRVSSPIWAQKASILAFEPSANEWKISGAH